MDLKSTGVGGGGVPGWLSWLSLLLLISARVMISGSRVMGFRVQRGVCFSLFPSAPLCVRTLSHCLSLKINNKYPEGAVIALLDMVFHHICKSKQWNGM